jgi:hypothetical protein
MYAFRQGDYKEALEEAQLMLLQGDGRGNILALAAAIKLKDKTLFETYKRDAAKRKGFNSGDPIGEIRSIMPSPRLIKKYADTLSEIF